MSVVVKKVKKKRLNVARTLVFILFIYLVVCLGLYVYNEPVRHYEISGITNISDAYVLRKAELVDYPPFVSLNLSARARRSLTCFPCSLRSLILFM